MYGTSASTLEAKVVILGSQGKWSDIAEKKKSLS